MVIPEAGDAPAAAARAAGTGGVDVFVHITGHVDIGAVGERLYPRGRIVLIAGRGRAELEVWPFEIRETQLLAS